MTLAGLTDSLDPETIRRAALGEHGAVDRLLRALQRPFYNLALRMIGDVSAAEDATQECLLRVITHLSQYRGDAKFGTWATRVAVNVIFDFRNGLARQSRMTVDTFGEKLEAGRD